MVLPMSAWDLSAVAEKAMSGVFSREVVHIGKSVAEHINTVRDACGGECVALELLADEEFPE